MDYREYQINPSNAESVIGAGFAQRKGKDDMFMSHTFTEYYMCIVLEGSGVVIDAEANAYPIMKHTVFQCIPGQTLSLLINDTVPWREFRDRLSETTRQSIGTLCSLQDRQPTFQMKVYPHYERWMNDIADSIASCSPEHVMEVYYDIQRFVTYIQLQCEDEEKAVALSVIRQASMMVLKNPEKPVSIAEIADAFFMSRTQFSRIFAQYAQSTPLKYLQHLKFCYAQRKIHEGMPLREVAAMFGYSDQFSFSKQYKKVLGISPSTSQRRTNLVQTDDEAGND